MSDTPQVYAAISAVQGELAKVGIGKDDYNQGQKFKFRGIDAVYNALAPILAKHGLVIIPQMKTCEAVDRQSRNGGTLIYSTVFVEYLIACAADGSTVTASAFGQAMDSGDKSIPKAMTAAYKYLLFELFCIPVEGTPDADADSHEVGEQTISAKEVEQLRAAMTALTIDESQMLSYYKISDLANMSVASFEHASKTIKKRSDQDA